MIEKYITSLELSKKLRELGFDQDSLYYWVGHRKYIDKDGKVVEDKPEYWIRRNGTVDSGDYYSAYIAEELWGWLPPCSNVRRNMSGTWVVNSNDGSGSGDSMVEAIAKLLIYLKEKQV